MERSNLTMRARALNTHSIPSLPTVLALGILFLSHVKAINVTVEGVRKLWRVGRLGTAVGRPAVYNGLVFTQYAPFVRLGDHYERREFCNEMYQVLRMRLTDTIYDPETRTASSDRKATTDEPSSPNPDVVLRDGSPLSDAPIAYPEIAYSASEDRSIGDAQTCARHPADKARTAELGVCANSQIKDAFGSRLATDNLEGHAEAFSMEDPSVRVWVSERPCASDTSPAVDDMTGRVFFSCDQTGAHPAGLLAFDGVTKKTAWIWEANVKKGLNATELDRRQKADLAVANTYDPNFAQTMNYRLADGYVTDEIWTDYRAFGDPAVNGAGHVAYSSRTHVVVFNSTDGYPLWQKRGYLAAPPQLSKDFAYITFRDGVVRRYNVTNGIASWDSKQWCDHFRMNHGAIPIQGYRGIAQAPMTLANNELFMTAAYAGYFYRVDAKSVSAQARRLYDDDAESLLAGSYEARGPVSVSGDVTATSVLQNAAIQVTGQSSVSSATITGRYPYKNRAPFVKPAVKRMSTPDTSGLVFAGISNKLGWASLGTAKGESENGLLVDSKYFQSSEFQDKFIVSAQDNQNASVLTDWDFKSTGLSTQGINMWGSPVLTDNGIYVYGSVLRLPVRKEPGPDPRPISIAFLIKLRVNSWTSKGAETTTIESEDKTRPPVSIATESTDAASSASSSRKLLQGATTSAGATPLQWENPNVSGDFAMAARLLAPGEFPPLYAPPPAIDATTNDYLYGVGGAPTSDEQDVPLVSPEGSPDEDRWRIPIIVAIAIGTVLLIACIFGSWYFRACLSTKVCDGATSEDSSFVSEPDVMQKVMHWVNMQAEFYSVNECDTLALTYFSQPMSQTNMLSPPTLTFSERTQATVDNISSVLFEKTEQPHLPVVVEMQSTEQDTEGQPSVLPVTSNKTSNTEDPSTQKWQQFPTTHTIVTCPIAVENKDPDSRVMPMRIHDDLLTRAKKTELYEMQVLSHGNSTADHKGLVSASVMDPGGGDKRWNCCWKPSELSSQLNVLVSKGVPLAGRFQLFEGNRGMSGSAGRCGGQGLVAFATLAGDNSQNPGINSEVAIKFHFNHRAFHRESAIGRDARLRHCLPPILYTSGAEGEPAWTSPKGKLLPPFMVLPKGEPLDEYVSKRSQNGKTVDSMTCITILMHLAQRLEALHAAGLVHRDVKPANAIMLEQWQMIDLGHAARIGESTTLAFTLEYAAPEILSKFLALKELEKTSQLQDADSCNMIVSPAVDVWALGLMAYFLLADPKKDPLFSQGMREMWRRLHSTKPLPWESDPEYYKAANGAQFKDLDSPFVYWVQRMLDRNPASRPEMREVIDGWRHAMGMKAR